MNQKKLLGPILLRFVFAALNFFFTTQVLAGSDGNWNFFSVLLATFATRDFVQAARLAQVYYYIYKSDRENKKKNKKK